MLERKKLISKRLEVLVVLVVAPPLPELSFCGFPRPHPEASQATYPPSSPSKLPAPSIQKAFPSHHCAASPFSFAQLSVTMFSPVGSVRCNHFVPLRIGVDGTCGPCLPAASRVTGYPRRLDPAKSNSFVSLVCSASSGVGQEEAVGENSKDFDEARQIRRSADWKAAQAYKESGLNFIGKITGFNSGGLLIRFHSLLGFLPFRLLSPSHSQKEPLKTIQDIAKSLVGSSLHVKVIQANEEEKQLIFSEKDAIWSRFPSRLQVGATFDGRVRSVEDYGAFVDLRFPDGCYHLTGLVHISEVSWDTVQDVRDILNDGDDIKVKIVDLDREKGRIALSIKQLEEDPLLKRLDKVIPKEGQAESDTMDMSNDSKVELLPGLDIICKELLEEDGITDVRIGRQGMEKRVVSQDLELWLSNAPAEDKQFTLLARAGRQVLEVHLTTTLDQDGIKRAVQRVLGRVP